MVVCKVIKQVFELCLNQSYFICFFFYYCMYRTLKAMKTFEAEEALIMKDVPGWNVGESVYNTGKWVPPNLAQLKFID